MIDRGNARERISIIGSAGTQLGDAGGGESDSGNGGNGIYISGATETVVWRQRWV
jgi:hypothetical protein